MELGLVESLSHETVRLYLKKHPQAAAEETRKKQWCILKVSADFVACIEHVLDFYSDPCDTQRPVVCFDETSTQLLLGITEPLPARIGRSKREDYEYLRVGIRNRFRACEPLPGWRHVEVTEPRTMQDFAHQMHWLVDEAYPDAPVVGWLWTI